MNTIASFTLIPLDVGVSLSKYIAVCKDIIDSADLVAEYHSNGTNLQGEWDEVLNAVRACHDAVHAMACSRIQSQLTLSTRTDRHQSMLEKQASVETHRRNREAKP